MLSDAIPTVVILGLLFCASGRCDTHYVSPEGLDEPPYLTPETAARTIHSALQVASPGDTVSVAPGDYNENIVMGPGLRLLGAGADNTRVWGGIEARMDAEITGFGVHQDCPKEDPAYASVAVNGPGTGGLIVRGCKISGTYQDGIMCRTDGGYALILDSEIRGIRRPPVGAGIGVWEGYGGRPLACVIDRCLLEDNAAGVEASSKGVWITRTRFSGNGTALVIWGWTRVLACSFDENQYGISVQGWGPAVIESCALTRNANWGLFCQDVSHVELANCTITANARGVVLTCPDEYTHSARSCIIWGNGQEVNVYGLEPGSISLMAEYCDIAGGWEGNENIDADPLFQDPHAGNFRLRPGSPCIDAGSDDPAPFLSAHDLDGKARVAYGGIEPYRVDMGAYEHHINLLSPGPRPGQVTLTWSSWHRRTYSIFYTDDLSTWHLADEDLPGADDHTTSSWIDDGSKTGVAPSLAPRRFYRVLENP